MQNSLSRRQFLHLSMATTAGALLAACVPATPPAAAPVAEQPASGAPEEQVTVKWLVWGGTERFQIYHDLFKKLNPDAAERITVENIAPGAQSDESFQFLRLAIASGTDIPDMMEINATNIPEFARAGQLYELDDMLAPYLDTLSDGAKQVMSYEDHYYDIAGGLKTKTWFYRQDLFEEAGIDVAQVKTFDDFLKAGEAFRAAYPEQYFLNIGPTPAGYWYEHILSAWDDTSVADVDGTYLFADNAHYLDMVNWLKALYDSDISFKTDDWSPDWQPAFEDESIGGWLVSNWAFEFLPQFAPAQAGKWNMVPWPEFNQPGGGGGFLLAIPAGAPNAEAAFTYIGTVFLGDDGAVERWKMNAAYPPVTSTGRDKVYAIADNVTGESLGLAEEKWAVNPINFFGGGTKLLDSYYPTADVFKVFPYDPSWTAERSILQTHTQAFLAGELSSAEEVLQKAKEDMELTIGNPYDV